MTDSLLDIPVRTADGAESTLREHAGYDHGYYFIQSFVGDHLRHHAERLG